MRWRIRYALVAILCVLAVAAGDAPAATRLAGIASSSKYLQYYGSDFSSNNLQTIRQFDVVALDPNVSTLTPAVVAYLQSNGVKYVLGYISIGEQMPGTPVLQGNGDGPVYSTTNGTSTITYESNNVASFYVDQTWSNTVYVSQKNGHVDKNGTFGGAYVWPNSDWRWVLNMQRIGGVAGTSLSNMFVAGLAQLAGPRVSNTDANRTHNFGMDGFFLDTLDTAGPFTGVGSYPWAAPEMQNTVKFIHDSYTNKVVFANRGLFFFNPLLVNSQFNIQPYAYTVRPYIHAGLFESYLLDSSSCETRLNPYVNDNKYDYARKISAEANRPDGFTMFSLDYQMNRGTSLYELTMNETVVSNGWLEYLCPDGSLSTIGNYALNHPRAADTSPPVWDSTANPGMAGGDISCPNTNSLSSNPTPPRVGIQALTVATNLNDVTVHWDIALDQTPPIKYNIYQSSDPSFATYVAYSNVVFQIGDGWSTDPVNSFANQYTIHGLTSGMYYFRVRAQDSSPGAYEDANAVTLSINVGDVNNAIVTGGLVLDGNLSDWGPLVSFGVAPQTFATTVTNPVELAQMWIAHDATNLYVAYQNYGPITNGLNAAYNLYLDTDGTRSTGYRGGGNNFPIGADYLLQGNTLYRYTGSTGTDWSWRQVGVATSAVAGSNAEFTMPQSWVGNPSTVNLFFLGDNTALPGGTIQDLYPNNAQQTGGGGPYVTYKIKDVANSLAPGAIVVNGDLSDWTSLHSFGVDPQSIVVDATNQIDLTQIWLAHDTANFFVAYQNYGSVTSNSVGWGYTLYLDVDSSRASGFRGSSDNFPIGADYMLQGNTIYQYTGSNGTDWSWSFVGTATWAAGGSNAEFSLPRVWIGSPSLVKLFFWGDNTAYSGSAQDLYPENALNAGGGGAYLSYRILDLSNPVGAGAIVVNGNLADWSTLVPFGQASQDFVTSSTNPVDLAQLRVAHNATNLYVAYQNYGPTTNGLNGAYNLYLDTDNNRSTGFRGGSDDFPIGAEYLLQGKTVYHYTGSGTDWNWIQVGLATSAAATSNVEFSLPQAWIGNPTVIGLFFLGDNPSIGGNSLDVYPNSGLQFGGGGERFTYRLLSAGQNGDSVGDGISDLWRQAYFGGNGATTNNQSCATCDPDGDGMSNLQEFLTGTNPTNTASAFRVISVSRSGTDIRVTWMTGAGKTNILQAAPNVGGSYSNVSPNMVVTGNGDSITNYLDVGGATNIPGRYYRVRLVP